MSKKFAVVFSIIAFCVLLVSVVYFAAGLQYEFKRGSGRAEDNFARISKQLSSLLDSPLPSSVSAGLETTVSALPATPAEVPLISRSFVSGFKNIYTGFPTVAALSITSSDGVEFAYPVSSPFFLYGDPLTSTGGTPKIEVSSPLVKVFSAPLNTKNLTLTAVLYTLQPNTIYYYGRNAFLIILAATLLVFIFIFADSLSAHSSRETVIPKTNKRPYASESFSFEDDILSSAADVPDTSFTASPSGAVPHDEPPPWKKPEAHAGETNQMQDKQEGNLMMDDDLSLLNDHFTHPQGGDKKLSDFAITDEPIVEMRKNMRRVDDDLLLHDLSESEPALLKSGTEKAEQVKVEIKNETEMESFEDFVFEDDEKTKEPALDPKVDPTGLFSDQTGAGWESYFETRLDAELGRAASSEQDLSVLLISVQDITHDNIISRKIANIIIEYFKFRDLVFEYEDDGFAGILQNTALDESMRIAESVFTEIQTICSDANVSARIGIGISTRVIRLLPAMRLIQEAKEALNKSLTEEGLPIVAFKADTEKYRKYIAEKYNKA